MKTSKKQCIHCGRWFLPDVRVGNRQRRCFREECRIAQERKRYRAWMKLHPDFPSGRRAKVRAWAKAYPNYWQHYRKSHPIYVKRDNQRRKTSLRKARCSAKQTSIRELAVGKLHKIQDLMPLDCSAKQTEIDRRVDGIMEYLFWTVSDSLSAKQKDIAKPLSISP